MTAHTPGPWVLAIDDTGGKWSGWPLSIDALSEPEKCVVRTGGIWPYDWGTATSQDEALANATLIAAAPDLLAALEALIQTYDEISGDYFSQGEYDMLDAAMKQGRGAIKAAKP